MIQEKMEQLFKEVIPEIEEVFGDSVAFENCSLARRSEFNDIVNVTAVYNFTDKNLDRAIIFNEYKAEFHLSFTVETEEEFLEKINEVNIPKYLIDWIRQQSVRATSYMRHYISSNYGSFQNWDKRRKIKILRRQE